jgi:hypothetical protein
MEEYASRENVTGYIDLLLTFESDDFWSYVAGSAATVVNIVLIAAHNS